MNGLPWKALELESPEIAEFGANRIDGKVAYLATIRSNGFPRSHPITPIVGEGRCFVFAGPNSSKVRDFRTNKNFCLHCSVSDSSGSSGEFQITGSVEEISDETDRALAESICSFRPAASYLLYELKITEAVATSYRGGHPSRKRWIANP